MSTNNQMEQYNHNNNDIDRLMERFFARQATDDEIRTLENWVMASDENREQFLRRRAAAQVIDATITPADIDSDEALHRITPSLHRAPSARVRSITRIFAAAASVLLVLSITLGILLHNSHTRPDDNPMITLSAPFGSMIQTTLPDGSTVWINANSTMCYPARFTNSSRTVSLRGEAFFEVRADKQHPFVVNTDRTSITATGTKFNVNAYSELAVTLVEGRVDVTIPAGNRSIDLRPGDHLSIKGQSITLTHNSNLRKWCGWRDGMLIFDNDPLSDVFNRLGQLHNIVFTVNDPAIAQSRFHATLTGKSISDILHLLELSAPIKFVRTSSDSDSITCIPAP